MNLMAISDIHGHIDDVEARWKPCDACIIAGDVGPMGKGRRDFDSVVNWWNNDFKEFCEQHAETQFLVMPGNAELFLDDEVIKEKGWVVPPLEMAANATLQKTGSAEWMGLKVFAYPWVAKHDKSGGFVRKGHKLKSKSVGIPRGLDILILHSIHGMHSTIRRVKPKWVIYGHEHKQSPAIEYDGDIKIMNVCAGDHESVCNDLFMIDDFA